MQDFNIEDLTNDVLQSIADFVAGDAATTRSLHQVSPRWRRACQQGVAQLRLKSNQLQLHWHQQGVQSFCTVSKLTLRFEELDWFEELDLEALASCLQRMPKLCQLKVHFRDPIINAALPIVGTLAALQELCVGEPVAVLNVLDFATLASLTALRSLSLYHCSIVNLGRATALTNTQELFLRDRSDSEPDVQSLDMRPLAALSTLRKLELGGVSLSDLAPLTALTALQTLEFWPVLDFSDVQPYRLSHPCKCYAWPTLRLTFTH